MKTQVKTSLSLLFLICCMYISAQKSQLYQQIEELKNKSIQFETLSSAITPSAKKIESSSSFINPNEVTFFDYNPRKAQNFSNGIQLAIPLKNKQLDLELIEVPEFFYDYQVVTDKGEVFSANRNLKQYRGVVKDDPNSMVAISFSENQLSGLICTNEGNFNIGLHQELGSHMIYNDKNLLEKPIFECHEYNELFVPYTEETLMREVASSVNFKYVKVYFETQFDIFQERGSVAGVEEYIVNLFNQVALIYLNERVLISLSEIFVWTTTDPYATATDSETALTLFENNRTSINGDIGQLLTFFNYGGLAYVNGLCHSSTKYHLSVAGIRNETVNTIPQYTRSVKLIAHELGHLLGSKHTHACVWNGNNTAIDGCWKIEGNCDSLPYPTGGGTIMSYCDQTGRPGVNFNLGFGLQPGNVIRNTVNLSTCLSSLDERISITGSSLVTTSGTTYTLNNARALSWRCSDQLIMVSSNATSATFRSVGQGSAWIEAIPNIGIVGPILRYDVWAGAPQITNVTGPNRVEIGSGYSRYTAIYDFKASPNSFEWVLNPKGRNTVYDYGRDVLDIVFYDEGSYQILVRATNTNGTGPYYYTGANVIRSSSATIHYYPNPTSDKLVITIENNDEDVSQREISHPLKIYDIRLYDSWGNPVRQALSKGEPIEFNVANLPDGFYYLHINKGTDQIEKQTIIIKH